MKGWARISCLLVTEKGNAVILFFLLAADTVQLKYLSYSSGNAHPPNVFYGRSSMWAPSLYGRKHPHYLPQTHNWNIPLMNTSISLCTFLQWNTCAIKSPSPEEKGKSGVIACRLGQEKWETEDDYCFAGMVKGWNLIFLMLIEFISGNP